MSNIKGHLFMAAIEYIKENYGEDGFKNVLDKLNPDDRAVVSKNIISLSWLPAQTFNHLLETADYVLSKGDYYLCREIGRYEAEKGINTFYKMYIRFGNPGFVLKRASQFWRSLHDEGKLEIEITGDRSAKARLFNYKDAGKAHCGSLIGYFEKVLEMSGAKDVQIFETKCQAKGDEYCEFVGNWEQKER